MFCQFIKKQKFINKTIYSVLNQTYRNFEIIIINEEPGFFSKKILTSLKKKDNKKYVLKGPMTGKMRKQVLRTETLKKRYNLNHLNVEFIML